MGGSAGAAAFITWSVQDPSLSHATSKPIHNIFGYPGAIGADLLMQILGLGSIMRDPADRDPGRRAATTSPVPRSCRCAARGAAWPKGSRRRHGGLCQLLCHPPIRKSPPTGSRRRRAWATRSPGLPAAVFGATGILQRIGFGLIFGAATAAMFVVASGAGSKAKASRLQLMTAKTSTSLPKTKAASRRPRTTTTLKRRKTSAKACRSA